MCHWLEALVDLLEPLESLETAAGINCGSLACARLPLYGYEISPWL